ncbi:MAG: DUF4176 domain-containing protein [Lachnospiraceae bacterium]|nr:DUF4176 domain-containing protein [Lachnospiraceae bacterium]
MSRDLLPIGSVVCLKGAEKPMMICGFCPTGPARPGYVYDYSGFPYPEGYMDTLKIYQFDSEQIEKVLALGYQDRETFVYMNALQQKIDDVKQQTAENYEKAKADAGDKGQE